MFRERSAYVCQRGRGRAVEGRDEHERKALYELRTLFGQVGYEYVFLVATPHEARARHWLYSFRHAWKECSRDVLPLTAKRSDRFRCPHLVNPTCWTPILTNSPSGTNSGLSSDRLVLSRKVVSVARSCGA